MIKNSAAIFLLSLCMAFASAVNGDPASPWSQTDELRGQGMPISLCEDGVVLDDGTNETGYGWVPGVIDGRYVQRFESTEFPSRRLASICVCWLRTRGDADIDFEIEFYDDFIDDEGVHRPVDEPYAAFPAAATEVPEGVPAARFYEFGAAGVEIPDGISFIGVRWDASVDSFFFVCADSSPATEPVEVFFRDELARGWGRALDTFDPTFAEHKALLLRVIGDGPVPIEIPVLGAGGVALLLTLLVVAGLWTVRRR